MVWHDKGHNTHGRSILHIVLRHFFSEDKQWDIFIRCTEAGKRPIQNGFQEHFHYWMVELRYLDSPKMDKEQAINLIIKHFPIAVQAYIQSTQEKKFLNIWEKLGELENSKVERIENIERTKNTQNEQVMSKNDQSRKFNNRYGQTQTSETPDNRYGQNTRQQGFTNRYGQRPTTQQMTQSPSNTRYKHNTTQQISPDKSGQFNETQKTVRQITMDNTAVENKQDSEDEDEYEYDEESKNGQTGIMASDLL